MEGQDQTSGRRTVARRKRAWWQWALSITLLGAAGGLTLINVIGRVPEGAARFVPPRKISISPDLKPSDVVAAEPGELSGSNLLLITYDTTRADRIGCYGYDKARTPAVDRLAEEGILFSRALSTSPTTLPAHSSLMTGLYPYHHGARANNTFHLDAEHTTLAEVLLKNGYATAAMVSAFVLDEQFGIDQGFEHYDDEVGEVNEDSPMEIAQRTADRTNVAAEQWLRKNADEKFFLWVHYYDPHFSYDAPKPFSDQNGTPYDAEVAFVDFHCGQLLAILDELQLTDDTLVVLAGDHGEGLGQHREMTHSCLVYDSVMRVPLVMRCGNRLGGGVHIDRPVSLVDVMPTVLTLLGIEGPAGMDGLDLTQPPAGTRPLFVEAFQGLADYGWAALLGVQEGTTKYIHGPDVELYDLDEDPFERDDLAPAQPQRTAEMLAHLEDFFGDDLDAAATASGTHQISPDDLRKLQALGYVSDSNTGDLPEPAARPHPRDMMPVLARMLQALALEQKEGIDAVIVELEATAEDNPEFAALFRYLGDAYRKKGDLEAAEEAYAEYLALRPGDLQPVMALADLKRSQRKVADAIDLYRVVLSRDPNHFAAQLELGRVLKRQGEFVEADEILQAALLNRPRDESIPDMLGDVAIVLNRLSQINEFFEGLLEVEPNLPMVSNALARLLAHQSRFAEAVVVLKKGIELAPDQLDLVNNLAFLLVSCPDPAVARPWDAIKMMERICEEAGYTNPRHLHTLSLIYAATHRMDDAIGVAERARQIATESDDPADAPLVPQIGLSIQGFRDLKAKGVSAATVLNPPPAQEQEDAEDDSEAAGEAPDPGAESGAGGE